MHLLEEVCGASPTGKTIVDINKLRPMSRCGPRPMCLAVGQHCPAFGASCSSDTRICPCRFGGSIYGVIGVAPDRCALLSASIALLLEHLAHLTHEYVHAGSAFEIPRPDKQAQNAQKPGSVPEDDK